MDSLCTNFLYLLNRNFCVNDHGQMLSDSLLRFLTFLCQFSHQFTPKMSLTHLRSNMVMSTSGERAKYLLAVSIKVLKKS